MSFYGFPTKCSHILLLNQITTHYLEAVKVEAFLHWKETMFWFVLGCGFSFCNHVKTETLCKIFPSM